MASIKPETSKKTVAPAAAKPSQPPKVAPERPAMPPRLAVAQVQQSVKPSAKPASNQNNAATSEAAENGPVMASAVLKQTPAMAVSMIVHVVVLLMMALIINKVPPEEQPRVITSTAPEVAEEFEELAEDMPQEQADVSEEVSDAVVLPDAVVVENVTVISTADDLDAAPLSVELADFSNETAPSSDLLSTVGAIGGKSSGLGGRSGVQRQQLVQSGGGNGQSEAAVEKALKWFIEHQMLDGGWSFDLKQCPSCKGQCDHSGDGKAADRCAATSMALLPFLGRGYTHKEGPYKKQFEKGISFLASLTMEGKGKAYGSGGNLYSQGIAGIVLSESFAMTQDKRLREPAQLALNFIMDAQDPVGGGWRYEPKQPGDTSAVGWQIMALKSGNMAYLNVNPLTIKKSVEFLNAVQADDGASYGYTDPGNGHATSAVGLLCRMYLGWKKDHPALQRGVDRLAKMGPSNDLYFNYYATQVMHHMEGPNWIAWNDKMRDKLVTAQETKGHMEGSWFKEVDGGHGAGAAGRIYCTSLATMILEVYYRHLPIYGQQSIDEDFKE